MPKKNLGRRKWIFEVIYIIFVKILAKKNQFIVPTFKPITEYNVKSKLYTSKFEYLNVVATKWFEGKKK